RLPSNGCIESELLSPANRNCHAVRFRYSTSVIREQSRFGNSFMPMCDFSVLISPSRGDERRDSDHQQITIPLFPKHGSGRQDHGRRPASSILARTLSSLTT